MSKEKTRRFLSVAIAVALMCGGGGLSGISVYAGDTDSGLVSGDQISNEQGGTGEDSKTDKDGDAVEDGKTDKDGNTDEDGKTDKGGDTDEDDKTGEGGDADEDGKTDEDGDTGEGDKTDKDGDVVEDDKTDEGGDVVEDGKTDENGSGVQNSTLGQEIADEKSDAVIALEETVEALPAPKEITSADKTRITVAYNAFVALTDAEKQLFDSELASKLETLYNWINTNYGFLYFDDLDSTDFPVITVPYGTSYDEVLTKLPSTLTVVNQGFTDWKYRPVTLEISSWDSRYRPEKVGEYVFTPYNNVPNDAFSSYTTHTKWFSSIAGYSNTEVPTVKVIVEEEKESDAKEQEQLSIENGTINITAWPSGNFRIKQGDLDITLSKGASLTVDQTNEASSSNQIIVGEGVENLNLVVKNLNLVAGGSGNWMNASPILIREGSSVALTLEGNNFLQPSNYGAAIALGARSELIVTGEGSLTVMSGEQTHSAGIGTYNTSSDPSTYSTIQIESGNIDITAGPNCAAIGGIGFSSSCDGGNIIINGGTINAKSTTGAAIGGSLYGGSGLKTGNGGNITINGGVINASSTQGAAIGGGSEGGAGNIVIRSGAKVTATTTSGGAAIGRGNNCQSENVGSILIEDGVELQACASGANKYGKSYFAIDAGIPCDISESVLNARFAYMSEKYYNEEIGKEVTGAFRTPLPINILNRTTNDAKSLTLPAGCHSFATNVNGDAADYMVQNGTAGKEVERASYTLEEGDSQFLFNVGGTMTTRDDLKFESFTITATAGENGSISDAGETAVAPVGGKTYTFTPNSGYEVANVIVNGEEMGAMSSYTFTDVQRDGTIEVTFRQTQGGIDPTPPTPTPDDPYTPSVRPAPRPTPTPEVIPEEETPLAPAPEEILDEETPLAPAPTPTFTVAEEMILDEETPLASAPKTGGCCTPRGGAAALFAAAAALAAVILRKKK